MGNNLPVTDRSHSRRAALARIGAAAGLLVCPGRASAATPLETAVEKHVSKLGFKRDLPGLAILIHQQGQPAFKYCVGSAILKDRTPVTPQTMFELASVSKSITATAILMLADRERLTVRDDVRKWIPELPEYDKEQPIRIRDLLHHTSGLASYLDFENVPAKNKDYWLNSDYVGEFARQKIPLTFPTGQKHEYNNTNYMLLAVVIERVTKQSYGAFLRKAIFDPCGMKTAFVNEGPGSVPEVAGRVDAIGYTLDKGKWQEAWGVPPARDESMRTAGDGSIWCSLDDMAAWDRGLLSGRLLKPATTERSREPAKTRDGQPNGYGAGWTLYFGPRGRLLGFGHNGGWGGFGTYYWHDLRPKRTMVFLGNGRPLDCDKLWEELNALVEKHGLQ